MPAPPSEHSSETCIPRMAGRSCLVTTSLGSTSPHPAGSTRGGDGLRLAPRDTDHDDALSRCRRDRLQKPMRQRASAALSGTQRSSSGTGRPPTHWRSLSGSASLHSSIASSSSGQSSSANSHELMHSAGVSSGQTSGRAHKPSHPVASLALPPPAPAAPLAPAAPAAPPLPAAPAAPPLPAAPAAPPRPAPPLAPAAPRPPAPPALLPARPAASSSPPSSSEQAGGKQMRSTGRSQAVRMQPA
jgi:hypothetical protein